MLVDENVRKTAGGKILETAQLDRTNPHGRCVLVTTVISEMNQDPKTIQAEREARAEMARYCAKHPRSPTAVRKPRLMLRGRSWVALLGYTLQDGVAGIGTTVGAALRAFDVQYHNSLKPPRG